MRRIRLQEGDHRLSAASCSYGLKLCAHVWCVHCTSVILDSSACIGGNHSCFNTERQCLNLATHISSGDLSAEVLVRATQSVVLLLLLRSSAIIYLGYRCLYEDDNSSSTLLA